MDQLKSGKELSAQWIANTQELLDSAKPRKVMLNYLFFLN
jgi:hypothetical protein